MFPCVRGGLLISAHLCIFQSCVVSIGDQWHVIVDGISWRCFFNDEKINI